MSVYLCAKSEKSSAHNRLRTCKGSFLFFFDILMLVQQLHDGDDDDAVDDDGRRW